MAIYAPDPFASINQTLLQLLMQRQQNDLAKEQLKIQQQAQKQQQAEAEQRAAQQTAQQQQAFSALMGATTSPDQEITRAVMSNPQVSGLFQNLGSAAAPPTAAQQAPLAAQAASGTIQGIQTERTQKAFSEAKSTADIIRLGLAAGASPEIINNRIRENAEADKRARLTAASAALPEGLRKLIELEQGGVSSAIIDDIAERTLPPTDKEKLDLAKSRVELATAQENLRQIRKLNSVRETLATELGLETIPDSVVSDMLRARDPQDMAFTLLRSLVTQVVVDPATGLAQPVFTIEEAAVRTERGMQMLTGPEYLLRMGDSDRATADLLGMASQIIVTNANLAKGRSRSSSELQKAFIEAAKERYGMFEDKELARIFNEARQKAGIYGALGG